MDHATMHASVMVLVNGKGPYLFQVDTYHSGEMSIDDDLVEKLGLVKTGTVLNSDGQRAAERDIVRVEELRLGGATLAGLNAMVGDYDWIDRPDGQQVDGVLGFASFRDLLLTFDYPGNRLVLSREKLSPENTHTIPFSAENSGSPDIT